jgi:hypothetical protein
VTRFVPVNNSEIEHAAGIILAKSSPGATMKKTTCAAALLLLLAGARSAMAQDLDLRLAGSVGLGYSDGNYGTAKDTDVQLGLTTLSAATDNFQFNVSMPYIRISGRGLLVFDAAGNPVVINRRTSLPADVRTGFGDLNLSTTYAVPSVILDDFQVKFTGRVKIPTASARRRLSTGKTDFGMNVDVSRAYGRWQPFVTIGYLIPGKPADFTLKNTLSVSTGTSFSLTDSLIAIASYDYDSASSPLLPSSQEMFGSLSWIVNDEITLTGYATGGLSYGSPDIGAGLIVTYGFN